MQAMEYYYADTFGREWSFEPNDPMLKRAWSAVTEEVRTNASAMIARLRNPQTRAPLLAMLSTECTTLGAGDADAGGILETWLRGEHDGTGEAIGAFLEALAAARPDLAMQIEFIDASVYDDADGPTVSAAAPVGEPTTFRSTAKVVFQAAAADTDGKPKRPSFQIHGYTGAAMSLDGFSYPVVVDLNGLRPPSPTLPVLRQHDPNRIVGQAQVTRIDESGVHFSGTVTGDNHDAKEVVEHARNGFSWQASIGADIHRREFLENGKKAVVNGKEHTGPMHIVRGATLKEVSFVPMGADGATSATVV